MLDDSAEGKLFESKTFKERWYYVSVEMETTQINHHKRDEMGSYAGNC